ncbi:MAG: hypothetical protein NVSMB9_00080 [Isosphaeraceae bacterium]
MKTHKKRKKIKANPTEIWEGFVAAPRHLETGLSQSLLYPLWGTTGLMLLVLFPPLLWISSLPIVTAYALLSAGTTGLGVGMLFLVLPAGMAFLGFFGYVLLFLGRVLASSAVGERFPPRWPDWELSSLLFGMGRWLWAGLIGLVIGGFPAVVYWVYCGDVDLFDMMIVGELLAAGAVYSLMALLASILHEDVLAANPFTVVAAIRRVGWSYMQPCLVAGFAVLSAGTLFMATFQVENGGVSAFLYWLFWVVMLYEALVVFRIFGLFYHKHAAELGWFRERTRWLG